MCKVSIIIPCYNCQEYVEETLGSLAKQTFRDFEVVCVNDGSSDNTLSILLAWQERKLLNMQIISKENGGVSRARNVGIRAAKGEYLLFLDADDMYHPKYIELLYNSMMQHNADVAYCWVSRDVNTVFERQRKAPIVIQNQNEAMHNLLYCMSKVAFCCYLYRKEWLIREQLVFDENTRRFEDREFNWKYLCHCKSVVLIDAPLYYYRTNFESATQSRKIQWKTERLEAVRRVEDYMEQMGCAFLPELKAYLFPRVMWSVAKNYATCGEQAFLKRLGKEYDVKSCMKRTAKDGNKLVAIASLCYLIHPSLFYHIVRLKKIRLRK